MRHLWFALFFLFATLPPAAAGEISPRLLEELAVAAPGEEIPVIVRFAAEADLRPFRAQVKPQRRSGVVKALRQTAEFSQQDVRELLRQRGKGFEPLWIVNGLALRATPELIGALAARPEVASIEADLVVRVPEVVPSQVPGVEDNIHAVGATDLWALGITGQGVTVAVLDSGVDRNHPDLAPRWRGGTNSWFDPYLNTTVPYDPNGQDGGHGTMVTGVILGGNAGGTAIGVAPGAQWIAAKVFDDAGNALNSRIIQSLQWVLDPNRDGSGADAPDLVNTSWGFDVPNSCITGNSESGSGSVRTAIQAVKAAGIGVIAASGNNGVGNGTPTSISPGNYPESLAVGAVDANLLIASFSGRGPSACDGSIYPELVAPGVHIRTADLTSGGIVPNSYAIVDGTSFSAPHVTGVMALLLSSNAFPTLTIGELENVLRLSAIDLGTAGADNNYGNGFVNANAAYNLLIGEPHLSVLDPAPPANDLLLDFGHLPPGSSADRTLTLRNSGSGLLVISGIGAVPSPFQLLADGCTNSNLGAGQSCTVTLRFAPPALGPFAGSLPVFSNDPDLATAAVQLAGTGNTLPPAAQLVAPGNGAVGVDVPVLLQWTQPADANGDPISHFVFLSTRQDFSDTVPQQAAAAGGYAPLLAGAGGLFLVGLAVGAGRRHKTLAAALLVGALVALLVACGGGGSSDDPAPPPSGDPSSFAATGLLPATTYYWKVVSEDSRNGAVESAVFRFTTR